MPSSVARYQSLESRAWAWSWDHLRRRAPAAWASVVFVIAGLVYFFWWRSHIDWGSPIRHSWNTSADIWSTFQAAGQIAHGQLSLVYQYHFVAFPGITFALAPVAAIASGLNLTADVFPFTSQVYFHPHAWLLLGPYVLVLSTLSLFAFDALAQRLGADSPRRVLLACVEAVAVWNVTVFWGHPEDAVAVGLMAYAFLLALDGRWNGAAWLFGFAVAFQPLVFAVLPILLGMAGIKRWSGFALRAVVPALAVVIGPLIANSHSTLVALVQQPNYPLAPANHQTPWTTLAPRIHADVLTVAAGPGRIVSLVLACVVGWWALRWRNRPELLVWAAALALALRFFTESVITPYYVWPALAMAAVASVRTPSWRFGSTLGATVFVTVTSQWHLAWAAWWALNVVGLVVVLLCALPLAESETGDSKGAPLREEGNQRQRPTQAGSAAARKKAAQRRRQAASRR
jgi:hypothetical protein